MIKIAEFKVRKNKVNEVLNAIDRFVEKIDNSEPGAVIRGAYKKLDDNSFIQFKTFKNY